MLNSKKESKRKKFLEAKWQNLCLFTYAVEAELLKPYLPAGLVSDSLNTEAEFAGKAFLSLVAFDFLDTAVFGVKWPGFINFPEINLRFYVKDKNDRGVVFIRELVPQFLVAKLARFFYNEPYLSCPMKSSFSKTAGIIEIEHQIHFNNKTHALKLRAEETPYYPAENGIENFFKEHRFGFGKSRNGKPLRYEVEHPLWELYPVLSYELNFDFGAVYADEFAFLNQEKPFSVMLARGSKVCVFGKEEN
ncbi:MAG: DUF2071 domain-containing protein [Candidatus Obscuribacterales bacterium]|nr:DUF2071 domain-containing protein [Candidatus Obscuribacterales bacterium]